MKEYLHYRLNKIQFEGFCRFIDRSLIEGLFKCPKIEDTDQEIEFQLSFAAEYRFTKCCEVLLVLNSSPKK